MDMPSEATRRLSEDHVAWLTTVTDSGAPAPNPVWFVVEDDNLIVYAAPDTRKVHNVGQRPKVCLHFNSSPVGDDVVVINGRAELDHHRPPSTSDAFVAKYSDAVRDELQTTMEEIDKTYNTRIRIRPERVRLTPT